MVMAPGVSRVAGALGPVFWGPGDEKRYPKGDYRVGLPHRRALKAPASLALGVRGAAVGKISLKFDLARIRKVP